MSPTTRNQDCENFQNDLFSTMRTQKLEASELQALYGEVDGDDGEEQVGQFSEECVNEFTYLAGQSPPPDTPSAHTPPRRAELFSKEEFYCRLEELEREHLENIADLQRLYLRQLRDGRTDGQQDGTGSQQVAPRHRQNPNQTLTDTDQSDASAEECVTEREDEPEWENTHAKQAHLPPPTDPPSQRRWCSFLKSSSSHSPANQPPRQVVRAETRRRGSAVTVPQPFQMTLREEDRKLRRVKTRSEVELENERLRKELDEMKECGKKFRATPVPASTHRPLREVINTQHGQRQPAKEQGHHGNRHHREKQSPGWRLQDRSPPGRRLQDRSPPGRRLQDRSPPGRRLQDRSPPGRRLQDRSSPGRRLHNRPSPGRRLQDKPSPRHRLHGNRVPPLPQAPFSFIERERKKKEKKLQEELNNLTPGEERRVFKARPVPRSLYRPASQDYLLYGAIGLHTRAQEQEYNPPAPPCSLEEVEEEMYEEEENEGGELSPPPRGWAEKTRSSEKAAGEREKRRNGVRDRDWSYIHPLRRASAGRSQEAPAACKSEYISV